MEFVGAAVFENKLKPQTRKSIEAIRASGCWTAMVTGDHLDTSIAIARQCGIVEEQAAVFEYTVDAFTGSLVKRLHSPGAGQGTGCEEAGAINGDSLAKFFQANGITDSAPVERPTAAMRQLVTKVKVFARTTPEQKAAVVKMARACLSHMHFTVAFCGDGANDTLALSEADVGLCLTKADDSLIAPFFSQDPEITCIVTLLREGKAALSTNFQFFRYFCTYSIIQTIGTMFLMNFFMEFSYVIFMVLDILLTINICNCIGLLPSKATLTSSMPKSSLLSVEYIGGIVAHCGISALSIWLSLVLVKTDPRFIPASALLPLSKEAVISDDVPTFECSVVALHKAATILAIQLTVACGICTALGTRFKAAFWQDWLFLGETFSFSAAGFWMLFASHLPGDDFFLRQVAPVLNVGLPNEACAS